MQNDVTQVDRDAAATLEPNNGYERDQILRGKRNKGAIVQILAAHRIAAEAAKDVEIAALQARVAELEGALGSAYYTLTYLEALEEDPLTKEAMKETRDEIDTVLAKEPTQ